MAIDLSNVIKETIQSTLELTIDTPFSVNEVFTCNQDCLNGKNIIAITSEFTFNNLTTNINYIYPAYLASHVFNKMMMEDVEPSLDTDDDIADAIKEVSAQISGSIVTAINGLGDEELGTAKAETTNTIRELGDNYTDISNLIMITFTSDDRDFEIFLNIQEEFLPFIKEFEDSPLKMNAIEPLKKDEEETETETETNVENNSEDATNKNIEQKDEDEIDVSTEEGEQNDKEKKEDENPDNSNADSIKEEDKAETTTEEDEQSEEDKQNNKIKKLIMAIAGLLIFVLISFAIMFFTGFFDAPVIIKDKNTTKPSPHDLLLSNIKNKQIVYQRDLLNIPKLNKRLSILTKYEILETDILEKYKADEKERLYKLKMKSLEEFALKNKEENLFKDDLNKEVKTKNRFTKDSNNTIAYSNPNELLNLIQIDALIYHKYRKIISLEKTKSTSISMCKNKYGKTMVYIGPLYINTLINNIVAKVGKRDAQLIRIKRAQFDKMCEF